MAAADLTAERLRELLDYNPDTGIFTWKQVMSPRHAGKPAGYAHVTLKYHIIGVDGEKYFAHRLAWLYTYGEWPKNAIDHINEIKSDNRISNLRDATIAENAQNIHGPSAINTSGFRGVTFHALSGKWLAQIQTFKKYRYLGLYSTPEMANEAYKLAKLELHNVCAK